MKMRVALLTLIACVGLQSSLEAGRGAKRYLNKETSADLTAMKTVYLGWVDMVPDDWAVHGYGTKDEWTGVILRLNNAFQRMCQTKFMSGRTVTGAQEKAEQGTPGADLLVKFSDVRIDYDHYHIYLSMTFVDPKTNTELGTIPTRPYYGNDWGFENYLKTALVDEVCRKIAVEINGFDKKK